MVTRRTVLAGSAAALLGLTGCDRPAANPVRSSGPSTTTPTASTPVDSTPSAGTPSAGSAVETPSATSGEPGALRPRIAGVVADRLDVPWGLIFLPSGDALVSERNSARLLRITPRGKVTEVGEVAGVTAPRGSGEGGLLGIAVDPDDPETLFAYITTGSDNRVVRLSLRGGKTGKPRILLPGIPTALHHHGGRLLFDARGLLLVSAGDATQPELAQDKASLAGKILRVRPDDGRAAPGNPFGNRTWSYGHRNVEGLAYDAAGRLWATEFGDKRADELNLIRSGRNYGWPRVEGRGGSYEQPKATWSPTSSCSPAGLAITRSTAFVGALQGHCLFSVSLKGTKAGRPVAHFAEDYGRIRNVAAAPDGSLWMTTSNTDGRRKPGRTDDQILRVTL